jgi:hypothetical protein
VELIIAGVVGGILLALILWKVIYDVVGGATHNLIRWAVYTFGNDDAVRRQREEDGL